MLQATFDPLNSWTAGIGYCEPWGHENQAVATTMLAEDCNRTGWYCDVGECIGGACEGGHTCASPLELYVASLYFSVMTVTSVGYGDIAATPFNGAELVISTIIMLLTGIAPGLGLGVGVGVGVGRVEG